MIIYGDGTERDNVRLDEALPTQCSQPTIPSACNPNGGPNLISREERRKRRREWKEHQLLEARQDDEIEEMNFEHHLDNEDKYAMEDTFASLQALLEESATPHQTQDQEFTIVAARPEMCRVIKETHEEKPHVDKMEETSYCLKAEDRNVPQKSGVSPGPIANQDSEEYSPPDFAMYNDDYEDDDNIDISTNHRGENGLSLVATRDKTSFKTRIDRKKEKTKCKKSRDQVKRTRSSPSSKPPFSTRHSHSKESGKPEESISYAITEVTQNERTIVGMR